jgi:ribosomal-protein-alanine N-acetyltransferase
MTSLELALRLARRSDAAHIAAMSRSLIEHGLRWSWTPERVAASIRDRNTHVLVACVDGQTIGFAIMRYGDEEARLDLFGVAHRYRRHGVGRRLLEWLEKCAVVAGIAHISLEVRAANIGAQSFYERMGYRAIGQLPGNVGQRDREDRAQRLRHEHDAPRLTAPD